MAKELDEEAVEAFRTHPLGAGPYTFLAADALVLQGARGCCVVGVHLDRHRRQRRELPNPGHQVTSAEDGAGWLAFFRDLPPACQIALVTNAHAGLVAASAPPCPAAAWRRCGAHYAANLMAREALLAVGALLHSIYDGPTPDQLLPNMIGYSTL